MKPEQLEIARLKREVIKLKAAYAPSPLSRGRTIVLRGLSPISVPCYGQRALETRTCPTR